MSPERGRWDRDCHAHANYALKSTVGQAFVVDSRPQEPAQLVQVVLWNAERNRFKSQTIPRYCKT